MSVNKYNASTGELTNIASGQRTWVGTQAAYKAAKQAGTLPNNAIIAITDDEVDHNHYSTEETETGMYWIDGKPIYRKVIDVGWGPNGTTSTPASITVPHNISNLDEVISYEMLGTSYPSQSSTVKGNRWTVPWITSGGAAYHDTYLNSTSIILTATQNTNLWYFKAIIEYTKTTD